MIPKTALIGRLRPDIPTIATSQPDPWRDNYWMDLRVFSIRTSPYNRFLRGRYKYLRVRGIWVAEQSMFRLMRKLRSRERIVPRFRIQPKLCRNSFQNAAEAGSIVYLQTKYFEAARGQ